MEATGNRLAWLIESVTDANEWSDATVVARANRAGHQFSKSSLSLMKRQGIATLVPDTMRALAAGLGVPLRSVIQAALETMGLPAADDVVSTPEEAIRADPLLDQKVKATLLGALAAGRKV